MSKAIDNLFSREEKKRLSQMVGFLRSNQSQHKSLTKKEFIKLATLQVIRDLESQIQQVQSQMLEAQRAAQAAAQKAEEQPSSEPAEGVQANAEQQPPESVPESESPEVSGSEQAE